MIFIRIIRNYFFKLGHVFCARAVKNFAKSEQFISKPGPRSIGNILLADKICDGKLFVFGNIFELGDKVIWDHSLSSIENYEELQGSPGWMTWRLREIKRLWKLAKSGFLAGSKNMDRVQVRAGRPN